ncbi:MAG TPA: hypothetical protein VFS76_15665 [Pyrinomonadaceae bacterium]|nr:hypothetical protein [Pyrinomonadaceae bacterium]
MDFKFTQNMLLGFSPRTWPGSSAQELSVSSTALEAAGSYAGSSHIFEMGRHYDAYVADEFEAPEFLEIAGFPSSPFPKQLLEKARSAGVTGNIGETLTGIAAIETFGCNAADIAHLVVRSKIKTPDFLIRKTDTLELVLQAIGVTGLNLPDWWLVESKSRSGAINDSDIEQGLIQLITLWFELKDYSAQDVGFGIVVGTALRPDREIYIHVFTPKNKTQQQALVNYLSTLGLEPKFTKSVVAQIRTYLS